MARGRMHRREFKLDVVRQVTSGERRPARVCREHGLAESLVLRRRTEVEVRGEVACTAGASTEPERLARRVEEFERFCGHLARENAVRTNALQTVPSRSGARRWRRRRPVIQVFRSGGSARCGRWAQLGRRPSHRGAGRRAGSGAARCHERIVPALPGDGHRRVPHAPTRGGWDVNHKCVLRAMRQESLRCALRRRFVPTTDATHMYRRYPELLRGLVVERLNRVWVADITSSRLPTGVVDFAAILDAFSRRCIEWKRTRPLASGVALAALAHAVTERRPPPGLIHHSDQGVQYASTADVMRLARVGAQVSPVASGNPYENAQAERFFRTIKHEGHSPSAHARRE